MFLHAGWLLQDFLSFWNWLFPVQQLIMPSNILLKLNKLVPELHWMHKGQLKSTLTSHTSVSEHTSSFGTVSFSWLIVMNKILFRLSFGSLPPYSHSSNVQTQKICSLSFRYDVWSIYWNYNPFCCWSKYKMCEYFWKHQPVWSISLLKDLFTQKSLN